MPLKLKQIFTLLLNMLFVCILSGKFRPEVQSIKYVFKSKDVFELQGILLYSLQGLNF